MERSTKRRTYLLNAERMEQLRIAKGLRIEDLAKKSKVSVATIRGAEKGHEIFLVTLDRLARALGVEDANTLIASHQACSTTPDSSQSDLPKKTLTFRVTVEIENYDQTTLPELIGRLFGKNGDVRDIQDGSVLVTVETDEPHALAAVEMFCRGDFPTSIDLLYCPAEESFSHAIADAIYQQSPRGDLEPEKLAQKIIHLASDHAIAIDEHPLSELSLMITPDSEHGRFSLSILPLGVYLSSKRPRDVSQHKRAPEAT